MEFTHTEHFVEGHPGERFMHQPDDVTRVVEACFSAKVKSALLYSHNLTEEFFDLSSGHAGTILQKLRTYRIRIAVVCPSGTVRFSRMFGEMVAEESRAGYFRIFESAPPAREWLSEPI
jgi:hypothetical protein